MSIIIEDMEIPKSCCVCKLRRQLDEKDKYDACGNLRLDEDVCIIQNKIIDRYAGRDYNKCTLDEYKTGKWLYNDGDYIPYCSECLMPQDIECNYCPSCGAKMI